MARRQRSMTSAAKHRRAIPVTYRPPHQPTNRAPPQVSPRTAQPRRLRLRSSALTRLQCQSNSKQHPGQPQQRLPWWPATQRLRLQMHWLADRT